MRIFDYFECEGKVKWIEKIRECDWSAAKYLSELLTENRFDEMLGKNGKLFILADNENVVSFATLTKKDCIDDDSLYPWIGFVFTSPDHRGHRYSERVIDAACHAAKEQGFDTVYLATDHVGFYEKYGFEHIKDAPDIHGEVSRVYRKEL